MTDTLRKLAEAATPGPWRKDLGDGNEMRFVSVDDANGVPIVMMDDFLEENGWTLDQSSIDFIAAANPTAVIALLDEIDALRAKVKAGRGIYTASKTTHAHLWKRFRADGYPIISTWLDEAGKGETKSFEDLWARCVSEAASCAALVAYRESGEILKGGLIEIGAALANGRPVFFVGDVEGYSFKAHPLVTICPDIETAFRRAQEADHG